MATRPLIGVLVAVAIVGAAWRRSRVRARARWDSALEAFSRLQPEYKAPRRGRDQTGRTLGWGR